MSELVLPKTVPQDLYHRLLEPFDSETSAKDFWKESPTTIIILDHSDSIEGSKCVGK